MGLETAGTAEETQAYREWKNKGYGLRPKIKIETEQSLIYFMFPPTI